MPNDLISTKRQGWAIIRDDSELMFMSKDWEKFTGIPEDAWTGNLDLASVALKNWQGHGQAVRLVTIEVESVVRITTVGEGETANIT